MSRWGVFPSYRTHQLKQEIMFIQTEETPNPLTLKFFPGVPVMGVRPPQEFKNAQEAEDVILAEKLLSITGVSSVFFGTDFISVTKNIALSWSQLKPDIFGTLVDYFTLYPTVDLPVKPQKRDLKTTHLSKVEQEIQDLIDRHIRPAVAMDGGDIVFERFDKGIVYLHLRGACSGCPSAALTLKSGIENMLKHYIPEIKEVRAIDQSSPHETAE